MKRAVAASPLAPPSARRTWEACPLCLADAVGDFAVVGGREYGECAHCGLIHLAPDRWLDPEAERARYALHRNSPQDPGYRAFLSRLSLPLVERLTPGALGLDYGAGPGPTLSGMLEEHGFRVEVYDPFFAPDERPLDRVYDFVTCTETIEHFYHPAEEFARLERMLRPAGWLALMTELDGDEPFEEWWYVRDPTHVCFYRADTMTWIAKRFGWSMTSPHRNVRLFQAPAG